MSAPVVDVADAIVAVLNAASLSRNFTAVRRHTHNIDRTTLQTVRVLVVPKADLTRKTTRGMIRREIDVDVAILAPATDEYDAERLMDFVEEIKDELEGDQMASADWVQHDNDPVYSVDNIDGLQQFTSVVTESYLLIE